MLRALLAVLLLALVDASVRRACEGRAAKAYRFCDTTLPAEVRARDIVSRCVRNRRLDSQSHKNFLDSPHTFQ